MSRAGGLRRTAFWAGAAALTVVSATAGYALGTPSTDSRGGDGPVVTAATHAPAHGFKPDSTRIDTCGDDWPCLEQAFGNVAFHEGAEAALALLDKRSAADGAARANCHRIAHRIGGAALAGHDGDVAEALGAGAPTCASGYYHGLLEHSLAAVESRHELSAVVGSLCAHPRLDRDEFLRYQCLHGLGHGLMLHTGYDLPLSLQMCERLASRWAQQSCGGGVFMENVVPSYDVESRWVRDDDPIYPCNAVRRRHKPFCYLIVTARILEATAYDWRATADVCRRLKEPWRSLCFESFGRDASGFTQLDAAETLRLCSFAREFQDECIRGAARDMTNTEADAASAAAFCRGAPRHVRSNCFVAIGSIVRSFAASPAERRAACAPSGERYFAECLRGAGHETASS